MDVTLLIGVYSTASGVVLNLYDENRSLNKPANIWPFRLPRIRQSRVHGTPFTSRILVPTGSVRSSAFPAQPGVPILRSSDVPWFQMECPPTELDALIRTAIERKRLVELVYGNRRRILQPDDYGPS